MVCHLHWVRSVIGSDAPGCVNLTRSYRAFMTPGFNAIIVPVKDVTAAKALYSSMLGVQPYVDSAFYVGFHVGDQQELGLDPNGHKQGLNAPTAYLDVADIRATISAMTAAGATVQQEPS